MQLAGDPAEVASYRILGRIGAGGQGVVYLGESPSGEKVAVKMLRYGAGPGTEDSLGDFRREIELARRVKAFCTASVLATGDLDGLPYIVSEYVDGPSLSEVIAERGVLRGAELRRLAIGTLTALAAIHQAGVVHRDFKPGNVLLSRDGPRVIDFGIARGLDVSERTGGDLVGTPPYMAPEQFAGGGSGAPADMFSWASTMVAAATGRPPFGTGNPAAVINRILTGEPDLGDLDGDLRDLVARCLAKEPDRRPPASRALLTLLGHPVPPDALLARGKESAAPPEPDPVATVPVGGVRARRRVAHGAAAVAVAMLAAGGGAYHLATRASGPPAATPPPATHRVAISAGPMPLTASATVTVPETSIKVRENPADPVWLSTAYDTVGDGPTNHAAYVRDPKTGEFAFFGNYQMPVASPGGAFLASLPGTNLDAIEANTLRLVDRARGEDVQLRVAGKPGVVTDLQWNEDQRLVLTIWDDRENGRTLGFVIVDAATKAVTVGKTPGGGVYSWAGPDHVIHQTADHTVRVLDLAGREVRSFRNVGELHPVGVAPVAGYGEVFSTACPPPDTGVCLWDAVTGAREAVVPIAAGARFDGWLDERHYLAVVTAGRKSKVVMVDLAGKAVRTLAEGPAGELERIALWFTRR